MTAENSAPSVYSPVKLKSSHICPYEWIFQLYFHAVEGHLWVPEVHKCCLPRVQHLAGVRCKGERGPPTGWQRVFWHSHVSGQESVNPGEVGLQDACLALFSLNPLVLVAPCYSLHVLHFRPDLLEESHQTKNLTNKPQRTSDLIRKYVSLLVNVGTARASVNGEHICY